MRSRRPSAETVRRTWRASKGLLRGEGEGNGEGEAADAAAAAGAVAALAAAGSGWAAWEGEEQEISSIQESTALIPDVSNSMVTLMDEKMTLELGKFSDLSSFTLTMPCLPTGGVATLLYKGCRQPKHTPRTSLRCYPLGPNCCPLDAVL